MNLLQLKSEPTVASLITLFFFVFEPTAPFSNGSVPLPQVSPDHITLAAVMSACGRAAEWQQSLRIFEMMLEEKVGPAQDFQTVWEIALVFDVLDTMVQLFS